VLRNRQYWPKGLSLLPLLEGGTFPKPDEYGTQKPRCFAIYSTTLSHDIALVIGFDILQHGLLSGKIPWKTIIAAAKDAPLELLEVGAKGML
jgi:hypothetical protein